ncbi:MAG: FtsX-like permease family protein [Bryobacterales bacterium]|nr:FtsX-like permease family protein [Bryobacterales bacterium]
MQYFLGAVGIATLLIGGIGVMNIMLVAVRERTREIGLRKAVGATAPTILFQFFVETIFVVLLSGGLGLGIAYGLCVGREPIADAAILCRSHTHVDLQLSFLWVAGIDLFAKRDVSGQPRSADRSD